MAKRGKTPKDVGGEEAVEYEPPSKLLSSILSTLDMTFERDTGMLNGKYVRVVPSREILSELKILLGKLHVSLDSIAKGDQEVISRIEKLKHGTGAVKDEQENDGSQPTLPQRRKRPPLTDIGR